MKLNQRATSVVAAVMSAIAMALIQPQTLALGANATSVNVLSVQSGSVRVAANSVASANTSGVALSMTAINGVNTFWVHNYGTLEVSAFTITVTLPNNANISSFKRCAINVSFNAPNSCVSGSTSNLSISVATPTTFNLALPAGSFYSFQLSQNKSGTMTVTTSASLANYSSKVVTS